jgi:hypothetical protein
MALGSTQPPTEVGTTDIPVGKGGQCVGLTTLPNSCADSLEIRQLQSPGNLRVCPGLLQGLLCDSFLEFNVHCFSCVQRNHVLQHRDIFILPKVRAS